MTTPASGKRPATPSDKDGAGSRRSHRRLAAGLLLACVAGIGYFALYDPIRSHAGANGDDGSAGTADGITPPEATTMPREPLGGRPARPRPAADDLASVIVPGTPAPSMGEVIDGLHRAGIRTGLGAFNPPGTSPPLVGLVVPDDFELPEGYVRHHQATDDGQTIEPILMYSPDYEFVDAAGQPMVIPADRVVRAANAPAGLPIRQVRIPPPQSKLGLSS